MGMKVQLTHFKELSPIDLYKMLQLRQMVFGLEQNCLYQDLDDRDQQSWHLAMMDQERLIGYARLIPEGISYDGYVSFGRVVTHPEYRRTGLGKALLNTIMQHMNSLYPYQNIQIGAQLYLVHFYKSVGFQTIGAEYLEDGIPHIHMICTPDQAVIAPQTSLKI